MRTEHGLGYGFRIFCSIRVGKSMEAMYVMPISGLLCCDLQLFFNNCGPTVIPLCSPTTSSDVVWWQLRQELVISSSKSSGLKLH